MTPDIEPRAKDYTDKTTRHVIEFIGLFLAVVTGVVIYNLTDFHVRFVVLTLAAPPLTLFPLLYAFFSPWWRSRMGRHLMFLHVALMVIIDSVALSLFTDFELWSIGPFVLYDSGLTLAYGFLAWRSYRLIVIFLEVNMLE